MTTGDLIAVMWDGREEPDSARIIVSEAIHRLRRAGWTISTQNRVGYRLTAESFDRLTLPINQARGRGR